ncbi:hypothetical protein BGZ99_009927 [Dissophora globulifera]|uniref:GATA-type domain-containing protein n=1 Tax=Dissophora globulifera TaxID=979702 RepID=A0A9P6R4K1_9FUNG|nr:hypothetical protein BGZ99_009927 [Dissophora globulifera]
MFPAHATLPTPASSALNEWFTDAAAADDLLLPQDIATYTTFPEDGLSPVLPLDSFLPPPPPSSPSSAALGAFAFHEYAPMPATDPMFQNMLPDTSSTITDETAHHAMLLHAYLAAQTQEILAQQQHQQQHQQQQSQQQHVQQWMLSSVPFTAIDYNTINDNDAHFQLVKQQQHQDKETRRAEHAQSMAAKIQQADADNLARYLAEQTQLQIKRECSVETAMDHDSVSAPQSPAPSSPSSFESSDDKSTASSPTFTQRSLSPDVASAVSDKNISLSSAMAATATSAATASGSSKGSSRQLVCFNCQVTQTPLWRRTPDRKHSLCNACGLYYKQYGAHRPLNARHKLSTILADIRLATMPYARPSNQASRSSSPTSPTSASAAADSASSSSDSDSDSGRQGFATSFSDLSMMYSEALMLPPTPKTTPATSTAAPLPATIAKQGIECVNCSQTQTPLWRKNEAGEPICNACGLYAKLHHRDRPVTMRKTSITRRRRDWGGNLAHRAQVQVQALALAHAQALAQVPQVAVGDSEEENPRQQQQQQQQQPQPQPQPQDCSSAMIEEPTMVNNVAQNLSSNMILDGDKFAGVVEQMNAHQMNRFLSILETRCGVLRQRILASAEAKAESAGPLSPSSSASTAMFL